MNWAKSLTVIFGKPRISIRTTSMTSSMTRVRSLAPVKLHSCIRKAKKPFRCLGKTHLRFVRKAKRVENTQDAAFPRAMGQSSVSVKKAYVERATMKVPRPKRPYIMSSFMR